MHHTYMSIDIVILYQKVIGECWHYRRVVFVFSIIRGSRYTEKDTEVRCKII